MPCQAVRGRTAVRPAPSVAARAQRYSAHMADKKVWFITGAGRGMGVDIAKAALAAGHSVVATGRNPDGVAKAVGASDDLYLQSWM
jgi:D-arabinose 1-dehydrogenase-like Zn-dependent alcohol dehydrogenase